MARQTNMRYVHYVFVRLLTVGASVFFCLILYVAPAMSLT